MTLTTKRTGVIRSTSSIISDTAEAFSEAATLTRTSLHHINQYVETMVSEYPENARVSRAINRAENISELMTTLSITEKAAITILDGK